MDTYVTRGLYEYYSTLEGSPITGQVPQRTDKRWSSINKLCYLRNPHRFTVLQDAIFLPFLLSPQARRLQHISTSHLEIRFSSSLILGSVHRSHADIHRFLCLIFQHVTLCRDTGISAPFFYRLLILYLASFGEDLLVFAMTWPSYTYLCWSSIFSGSYHNILKFAIWWRFYPIVIKHKFTLLNIGHVSLLNWDAAIKFQLFQ